MIEDTMMINYNKKISRLIVIGTSLEQLRTELIESGRVLRGLLKKPCPDANAVLAAVETIHNLLYREGSAVFGFPPVSSNTTSADSSRTVKFMQ